MPHDHNAPGRPVTPPDLAVEDVLDAMRRLGGYLDIAALRSRAGQ